MAVEFTEYVLPGNFYGAMPQMAPGPANATQQVAIGAATAASDPFGAGTQWIVLTDVSADCRIAIGAPGTEARNTAPLSRLVHAGESISFLVSRGNVLAVIQKDA